MPLSADRIQESAASPGSGSTITLGGAVAGFLAFSPAFSVGNDIMVCVQQDDLSQWEVAVWRLTATTTLTRQATIYASSNSGSAPTYTGPVKVFATWAASEFVRKDAANTLTGASITANSASATFLSMNGTTGGAQVGVIQGQSGLNLRSIGPTAGGNTTLDLGATVTTPASNSFSIRLFRDTNALTPNLIFYHGNGTAAEGGRILGNGVITFQPYSLSPTGSVIAAQGAPTPAQVDTINGTSGSPGVADVVGASLTMRGGAGTGSGAGGSIIFQTAPAGTAGLTSVNAHATRMQINSIGAVTMSGVADASNFNGLNIQNTGTSANTQINLQFQTFTNSTAATNVFAIRGFATDTVGNGNGAFYVGVAGTAVPRATLTSTDLVLGGLTTSTAPPSMSIGITTASGTDVAGGALTIKGGAGTGVGVGGSIVLQTAPASGSTGSSANAHVTRLSVSQSGIVTLGPSTSSTLLPGVLQTPSGTGTNNQGSNIIIRPGAGTGSATGGGIFFQIADVGTSGTTTNGFTTRMQITTAGDTTLTGNLSITGNITSVSGTTPFAASGHSHSSFTTSTAGYVPAPGSSTGLFLRDDGAWAAAGGGGGGGGTRGVQALDFGSTPIRSKTFTFTQASAVTSSVIQMAASPSTAGGALGGDELEMDGFTISAYCAVNGTITAVVTAAPGPVTGIRNFTYSF